jgi:hypothetical protein
MTPQVTDYLDIEATLQTRLLKAWRPVAAALYKKMLPLLADGKYDDALHLAKSIDLGPIATKNRAYIKAILWKSAEFGAKLAARSHKTAVGVTTLTNTLNKAADQFTATFVLNATKQVYESALHSIANVENAKTIVTKAEKKVRFVRDFVSFREEGEDMIRMVSSLATSRLAVWGFTAEAEVRNIQTYKLSAVLDNRTSRFCRFIDGKEFKVADARQRIIKTLEVTNPDDLKTAAPWPPQTIAAMAKLEKLSNTELAGLGYSVPPFHPNCRTMCVLVDSAVEIGQTTFEADDEPELDEEGEEKATEDSFSELGLNVNDQELAQWNALFNKTPADVLSAISDTPVLDVLSARLKGAVRFTKQGAISLKTKKILGEGAVDTNMVFDPYREQVFVNYAEFENAPPVDAAEYLGKMYRSVVSLSKYAGATTVVVNASGDFGAYAHAKMGFVPSSDEWAVLSAEIEAELPTLGLTQMQEAVVEAIVSSGDPKAIWALAELNTKVKGMPLGKLLLEDKSYQAILNLDDNDAMERLGWFL